MKLLNKKIIIIISLLVLISGLLIIGWSLTRQDEENNQAYEILSIDESYFKFKDRLEPEDYQEALDQLNLGKEQIEKDSQGPIAWYYFGYYKNYLGDREGARLAWEEAFELNPKRFTTSNNLADLYANYIKDYDRAEFFYLKSLDITPNYSGYMKLADLYQYKIPEKKEKIEPLLLEAAEKDPDNKLDYFRYLAEYFEKEGYQQKIDEYR